MQNQSNSLITFDTQLKIALSLCPVFVPNNQIIDVNLTSVTFRSEGTPSLDQTTRVARVRIEASDAPHGVVEFAQASYNASEGSTVYLVVSRRFGTAGDIRVFYR